MQRVFLGKKERNLTVNEIRDVNLTLKATSSKWWRILVKTSRLCNFSWATHSYLRSIKTNSCV